MSYLVVANKATATRVGLSSAAGSSPSSSIDRGSSGFSSHHCRTGRKAQRRSATSMPILLCLQRGTCCRAGNCYKRTLSTLHGTLHTR
jgi:hypothetical protein